MHDGSIKWVQVADESGMVMWVPAKLCTIRWVGAWFLSNFVLICVPAKFCTEGFVCGKTTNYGRLCLSNYSRGARVHFSSFDGLGPSPILANL